MWLCACVTCALFVDELIGWLIDWLLGAAQVGDDSTSGALDSTNVFSGLSYVVTSSSSSLVGGGTY